MYKFLLALALLFGVALGFVSPANASMKHRHVVMNTSQDAISYKRELVSKIAASVSANPLGTDVIDKVSCERDKACGTASQYLGMFREIDSNVTLASGIPLTTVAQVSEYIDGLVMEDAPVGKPYWVSCLYGANPRTAVAKLDCLSDKFEKGEKVLVDPRTHRIMMRVKCSNPVHKPDESDHCVYKHVFLKADDEFHSGWLGPDAFPKGDCIPAIKKATETEWSNALLDECPRDQCDFSGPSRDLGNAKIWDYPRISFKAEIDGEYVIRLPVEVTTSRSQFDDCVVRFAQHRQTYGNVTHPWSYTNGHAYLTYKDDSIVPADWHGLPHPWKFTDGKFK